MCFRSGRPYQERALNYKENRANFEFDGSQKRMQVNFNSDFDFSDTEDKGGSKNIR